MMLTGPKLRALLRMIALDAAELEHAPEGLELFAWYPAKDHWNPVVLLTDDKLAHYGGDEPPPRVERDTFEVHPAFTVELGDRKVWVGWNAEHRAAVAWVL